MLHELLSSKPSHQGSTVLLPGLAALLGLLLGLRLLQLGRQRLELVDDDGALGLEGLARLPEAPLQVRLHVVRGDVANPVQLLLVRLLDPVDRPAEDLLVEVELVAVR